MNAVIALMCVTAVPGPPEAVSVSDVLSTSCVVTYQPPLSDGGSPVTGYRVERLTPGSRWIAVGKDAVAGLTCPVTDLLDGNEYEFRVAAENKAGVGEFSAVTPKITAKNPWDKPGKPGRPAAVEVVGASVKLDWKAPDRYCSLSAHYWRPSSSSFPSFISCQAQWRRNRGFRRFNEPGAPSSWGPRVVGPQKNFRQDS